MSPVHRTRLLALSEREFKQRAELADPAVPVRTKFKPMRLNLSRFDRSWDQKRGAAMRLTGVLLQEDHEALERRVCESSQTAKTYSEAAVWLQRESAYLRKIARLLDTATGRLTVVLGRCGGSQSIAP